MIAVIATISAFALWQPRPVRTRVSKKQSIWSDYGGWTHTRFVRVSIDYTVWACARHHRRLIDTDTLHIGWSDVIHLWSQCDRHLVGQHVVLRVVKYGEDLSRYSNNIESVGLRKCPYYRYLIEKVTSTNVRTTNISQSLPPQNGEKQLI